jgi:hypothetical protein
MKKSARLLALTIVAAFAMTVFTPLASHAGTKGKRNTAIGLSMLSAYLLMKGETIPGLIAAAGAGYAWDKSNGHNKMNYRERNRHDYKRSHDWDHNRGRDFSRHHRDNYQPSYGYRR